MAKTPLTAPPSAAAGADARVQFADPQVQHQSPKLTTRWSDEFGAQGQILDLGPDQVAAAPEGLLADPTPDQLALRRS